jgi:lysophospholipase L1-like esterase
MNQLLFLVLLFQAMHTLNAQDWAQLDRFKQTNAQLAEPKVGENRVVFIGNSITEGWLQESLSLFKNKNYINRGIGGQTTSQMKLRFMQDVVELKPRVVVILAGINDIAENTGPISVRKIAANIEEMTQMATASHIKVVICSVLPANYFPWRPQISPAEKVISLNLFLKQIALKNEGVYLDYYTEMVDDKNGMKAEYTTDGVHCTIEGYKVMELLIENCLLHFQE